MPGSTLLPTRYLLSIKRLITSSSSSRVPRVAQTYPSAGVEAAVTVAVGLSVAAADAVGIR